jgi:hypothetical protein
MEEIKAKMCRYNHLQIFSLQLCDNLAAWREKYEYQYKKIPGNN